MAVAAVTFILWSVIGKGASPLTCNLLVVKQGWYARPVFLETKVEMVAWTYMMRLTTTKAYFCYGSTQRTNVVQRTGQQSQLLVTRAMIHNIPRHSIPDWDWKSDQLEETILAKHFIGLGYSRKRIGPWPKFAWLPTRGRAFIYICMISTEFLKRDRTVMGDKKTELSVEVSKLPEPYQLIVVPENNQHQKENHS